MGGANRERIVLNYEEGGNQAFEVKEVIMLENKYLRIPSLLIVFISYFLSNVSAFYGSIIWLTPPLVLGESIIWVVLASLSIWILNKQHNIAQFLEKLRRNWIILPFFIFSGLSIFWSFIGKSPYTDGSSFFCTIITGGYIGLRYDIKEIIKLLSFLAYLSCS